jgi:diguanylate cyclase (GGDEF)-like protein
MDMAENEKAGLMQMPDLLGVVLDALPVGVWIMDRDGRIVHGNPEAQKIWAGSRYVGVEDFGEYKGWWHSTGKHIEPEEWAAARAISKGESSLNEEIEIECFDGTRKVILNSAMPIRNEAGEIIGGIIVNVDITERIGLEDQLRTAADTDELTQTWNRRHFYELLHAEMQRAERYRRPLSLIMLDVDHFKQINDTHGHAVGDQVLVFLSREIQNEVRVTEHLARVGGDEFMLLLPETGLEEAANTARRLHRMLAERPLKPVGAISCSIGVCEHMPGESSDDFMRRADEAMYEAKEAGRGRVTVAS